MSEAIILLLLLEGSMAIQSKGLAISQEIKGSCEIKDLELLSYNLLLDMCINMKRWATDITDSNKTQNIYSEFSNWKLAVVKYAQSERGIALSMSFETLNIEMYDSQPLDSVQMNYIGENGNEVWHISCIFKIELREDWITRSDIYRISIAA